MESAPPFHPLVTGWFTERFGEPTAPQRAGWREIASGRHTLIAAPTGSGTTLAAFLWAINRLVDQKTRYDNAAIKSASAVTGTATFTYAGGQEKTLAWKKVAWAYGEPEPSAS
jgi:ATP-dependent Lhr-like helicase